MTKNEFKEQLEALLTADIQGLSAHDKVILAKKVLFKFLKDAGHSEDNKGKPWSDDELRIVLAVAPTHENILKLARAFKRGYGSIEQIFRWAGQSENSIKSARSDDAFIQQIRRIRKEIGWRSVGGDTTASKATAVKAPKANKVNLDEIDLFEMEF
jgi:hypothetical protein